MNAAASFTFYSVKYRLFIMSFYLFDLQEGEVFVFGRMLSPNNRQFRVRGSALGRAREHESNVM